MGSVSGVTWVCASCLRSQARSRVAGSAQVGLHHAKQFTSAAKLWEHQESVSTTRKNVDNARSSEPGALSRRLAGMAEETMDTGSKSDHKLMADAGFSEDLKKQLEERITQSAFRSQHAQAFSEAAMPSAAGKGTRQQAAAEPWSGTESLHDSALRMLDDSYKKLRAPARVPRPVINLRPVPKPKNVSAADRLANARDKTSIYALSQQTGMTDEERKKIRQELKDRFSPGARPMPTSLQGLTSLANERIEDAIARGQFKNIQRGKGVNTERDYAANSPFLDTTEYFMNKLIQKQEIVPPWIEKQQELIKLVSTFRARLRNDWRRHAARMIASKGGTVQQQVQRARSYALTEEQVNPSIRKSESMSSIDSTGSLTTITFEEKVAANISPDEQQPEVTIQVTERKAEDATQMATADVSHESDSISVQPQDMTQGQMSDTNSPGLTAPSSPFPESESTSRVLPMPYPYRDPEWERLESAYHKLAVEEINSLARSYNLMAPKVAQKPYHTLERELKRCYADVAPQLPDEILQRSRKLKIKVEVMGHREGTVLSKFQGTGHISKVRDEDTAKGYGFKQFWKDLFRKDERVGHRRGSMV